MEQKIQEIMSRVNYTHTVSNIREKESYWEVYAEGVPKHNRDVLMGGLVNVVDYLNPEYPVLAFPITKQPDNGMIFRNVYLIDNKFIPDVISLMTMNNLFIQRCLPQSNKEPYLTFSEQLNLIFESERFFEILNSYKNKSGLKVIGVHGGADIHFTRGMEHGEYI